MEATELARRLSEVIINPIIALLFAAGLLVFISGIIQFIWGLNTDSEKKEQGKKHMLWGIVGMFIMVAAYTILQIVGNSVGSPVPSSL